MINRGGEKISPREIDEVLLTHPAIAEAVCFGVPHRSWGEEVAAAVVLRATDSGTAATEAELLAFCKRAARRLQASETDSHHGCDSPYGDREDSASHRGAGVCAAGVVKIVIAGAGAIGGYIGARLTRAGADVVLFARGPHLRAMQERGLRVISPDGDFEVKPEVSADLATIGQADVVFLGVKAHSLTGLAPQLRPLLGPETLVVSTQNGIPWWYFQDYGGELDGLRLERVDPGGVIAAAIEPRRVVGSLAYFATDVAEPGVIHHTEGNRISLGEPNGTRSDRTKALAEVLIGAGFRCPVSDALSP